MMLPVAITLPATIVGAAIIGQLASLISYGPVVLPLIGGYVRGKVVDALKDVFGEDVESSINDFYNDAAGWILDAVAGFQDALRNQLVRLIDPIVLDLDGNGIDLSSRENSNVYFDMDGDGIRERTGWINQSDGLLTIDKNLNGRIDGINELVGNQDRSGFAELQSQDINNDSVINSADAVWSKLKVWIDSNTNGVTDGNELRTMSSLNIRSIDLRYTTVNFVAEGNHIHEQSIFEYTNGDTRLAADIWFDVSNFITDSAVTLTGNSFIDDLPDIRGHGDVKSLRAAMSSDQTLANLVSQFVSQDVTQLGAARSQVEEIIFRWSGVQNVEPSSRGGIFDGRKLAALENFLGTEFVVQGQSNPNSQAAASLNNAWNDLVDGILSRIMISGPLRNSTADFAAYVPELDRLSSVRNAPSLLRSFSNIAPTGDDFVLAGYWAAVLPVVREIIQDADGDTVNPDYESAVSEVLAPTGLAPFARYLDQGIVKVAHGVGVLSADGAFRLSSDADQIRLSGEKQAVFGDAGNDRISASNNSYYANYLLDGGAGSDTLQGGSGQDRINGGAGADVMYGGAGDDTFIVDNTADRIIEASNGGRDLVQSSVSYTLGANLEDLTLTGTANLSGTGNASANALTGNSGANALSGLTGDDRLDGGLGADTLKGGLGRDTYIVDNSGDKVIEEGTNSYYDYDEVVSSITYTAPVLVEAVTLTGTANLNATGNALDNRLTGNDGANTLDGLAGADAMHGGKGNDTYVVDHSSDQVYENDGEGTDAVRSYASFSLGSFVENLTLVGTASVDGNGNELVNTITGNSGDNRLDGGAGADRLTGGAGDDTYVVDNTGDRVTEAANGGVDTIATNLATYTIGAEIENLRLYTNYYRDDVARNGTGNALDNVVDGNDGANRLYGLDGNDSLYGNGNRDILDGGIGADVLDGGAGADTMTGGTGDDTFYIDDAGDRVTEAASGGTDTVVASLSQILGTEVENLQLVGYGDMDGQGNGLANTLTGNAYANKLDGGTGADTMIGDDGDDTYTVDNVGDQVIEAPGAGTDSVRSSISYKLDVGAENLTLLGTTQLSGTGNELYNNITGNAGANVLDGDAGNDVLQGAAGSDTFVFSSALVSDNIDRIVDFTIASDKIKLSSQIFTALPAGQLSAAAFKDLSKGAVDADDRILYDKDTGNLFYDTDGSGTASNAVQFAILDNRVAITNTDLLVA